MKPFRLHLRLEGPLGTPLSADTLFGHLCWGIVYHEGTAALETFLAAMRSADPPLVFGDPMPAGFLPAPVLPPRDLAEADRIEAVAGGVVDRQAKSRGLGALSPGERLKRTHALRKGASKAAWLPADALATSLDDLSAASVFDLALDAAVPPALCRAEVVHNTINRLSQHTADEGGLYVLAEEFPPLADGAPRPGMDFDVYLLTTLTPGRVRTLFEQGLAGGYGRDASAGKGKVTVGDLDDRPWPAARDPNAALALGVFAPASDDPAQGWWRITVRLGKLGGPWAFDDGGRHPPFKYPLILLRPGAVLAPLRRQFLGRVVEGIHPTRPEVVTYAMAPVLPVRCPALATAGAEVA